MISLFKEAIQDSLKFAAGLQLQALSLRKDYLFLFFSLKFEYQNFRKQYHELEAAHRWRSISNCWENVSEFQKRLSNFGLQVFCNLVSHVPPPDFTREPKRRMLLFYAQMELDLDSIGYGTKLGLHKGRGVGAKLWSASKSARVPVEKGGQRADEDASAWDVFCEVVKNKLADITSQLLEYDPEREQTRHAL